MSPVPCSLSTNCMQQYLMSTVEGKRYSAGEAWCCDGTGAEIRVRRGKSAEDTAAWASLGSEKMGGIQHPSASKEMWAGKMMQEVKALATQARHPESDLQNP